MHKGDNKDDDDDDDDNNNNNNNNNNKWHLKAVSIVHIKFIRSLSFPGTFELHFLKQKEQTFRLHSQTQLK